MLSAPLFLLATLRPLALVTQERITAHTMEEPSKGKKGKKEPHNKKKPTTKPKRENDEEAEDIFDDESLPSDSNSSNDHFINQEEEDVKISVDEYVDDVDAESADTGSESALFMPSQELHKGIQFFWNACFKEADEVFLRFVEAGDPIAGSLYVQNAWLQVRISN